MNNRTYHLRMLLNTLYKMDIPTKSGDTRAILDVDSTERNILVELILVELKKDDPA